MTDLSAFGVECDDPVEVPPETAEETAPHRHESFPNGRCRAVKDDGRRCRADSRMSADVCGSHDGDVTTIDDGPKDLIGATTGTPWRDFGHVLVRAAIANREFELEHGGGIDG